MAWYNATRIGLIFYLYIISAQNTFAVNEWVLQCDRVTRGMSRNRVAKMQNKITESFEQEETQETKKELEHGYKGVKDES